MNTFNRLGDIAVGREKKSSLLIHTVERIARVVHAGQLYGGLDYVDAHLLPVADIVRAMGYGELHQATAVLHDGPEDNKELTREYLIGEGAPAVVVDAVFVLDKSRYDSHGDYRVAVGCDPLATVSKIGDSLFNLNNILRGQHSFDPVKALSKIDEYCGNLSYLLPRLPARDLS